MHCIKLYLVLLEGSGFTVVEPFNTENINWDVYAYFIDSTVMPLFCIFCVDGYIYNTDSGNAHSCITLYNTTCIYGGFMLYKDNPYSKVKRMVIWKVSCVCDEKEEKSPVDRYPKLLSNHFLVSLCLFLFYFLLQYNLGNSK